MAALNQSKSKLNTVDQFEQLLGISQWKLYLFPDLVENLLAVKIATSRANLQIKKISKDEQKKIEAACDELMQYADDETFFKADLITGGGMISVHVNIFEAVAKASGVDVAKVNFHQSTSDVCLTALHCVYFKSLDLLSSEIALLRSMIEKKKKSSKDKTTVQTCLRDGYQDTFANLLSRYEEILGFHLGVLRGVENQLLLSPLGGTVTGDGHGAPSEYQVAITKHLNEVTGLKFESYKNRASDFSFSQTDKVFADALMHFAEDLLQMAKELRLLFSGPEMGYAQIELPKLMQGSSFFSDKNNPLVLETIMTACMRALGLLNVQTFARAQRDFYLDVFKSVRFVSFYEAIFLLCHAVHMFGPLVVEPMQFKKGKK